jgi:hypothetical protein
MGAFGFVVCERRGQLPVGFGLGEQVARFLLEGSHRVGTGGPAKWRFVLARSWISALAGMAG